MNDTQTITRGLPPEYTTTVTVDVGGFVRISGVCVGRIVTEGDVRYFEVKDRNASRSLSRGAQMIRVPVTAVARTLQE